jgi:anaerobic dimethyl sulfoxide reductase subunit B (iron-sulfur subunit)
MPKIMFVDYNFCTGCHACELSCQNEHGLSPENMGIVVEKIGPFQTGAKTWQYDFFPAPTDFCDGCEERVSKGKRPACVQHCQTQCLEFGESSEFIDKLDRKRALFVL